MIRLLVCDDHPSILAGFRDMFKNHKEIILAGEYLNGRDLLNGVKKDSGNVLLLDIDLPDTSGIELCKQIRILYPELKIIAFTSYNNTRFVKAMMQSGASGYLLKNAAYEEILLALEKVMNDEEYLHPDIKIQLLKESLNRKTPATPLPKITRREKEILKLITHEKTTREIAKILFISEKTVESHRLNLIRKFEVKNTAGLVRIAVMEGLIN